MAKYWNVVKANAVIEAAEAKLAPALAKANIATIPVDGKPVPAAQAPLDAQIEAVFAANPPGEASHDKSELLVTNATLADELQKREVALATANATVGSLQSEKQTFVSRAEAAEASVLTLTAEKGQLNVQLKAAQSEYDRVSREQAAFNTELSKACIAVGCLQLTDANGAALSLNASEAAKLEAANKIPLSDKLKAYQGAVNQAITATGLNVASLPGAPLKFVQSPPTGILGQYNAITDPMEKTAFYRKHKAEIREAARATQEHN